MEVENGPLEDDFPLRMGESECICLNTLYLLKRVVWSAGAGCETFHYNRRRLRWRMQTLAETSSTSCAILGRWFPLGFGMVSMTFS